MRTVLFAMLVLFLSGGASGAQTRILLQDDTALYVGAGGSDENDCLSLATACATLQHVVNTVYQSFDLGCHKLTINIVSGSAISGATARGPMVGQCGLDDLLIIGNTSKVLPNAPANNFFPYNRTITSTIAAVSGARLRVEGVRIVSSSGSALSADDGLSRIEFGYVDFGQTAGFQIVAGPMSRIKATNDYAISGGGAGHANAPIGQFQIYAGVTVNFVTSETAARPNWSVAFVYPNEKGVVNMSYGNPATIPAAQRTRFVNANGYECSQTVICATGQRWAAAFNGLIMTNGSNIDPYWFPGSSPGWISADSVYN